MPIMVRSPEGSVRKKPDGLLDRILTDLFSVPGDFDKEWGAHFGITMEARRGRAIPYRNKPKGPIPTPFAFCSYLTPFFRGRVRVAFHRPMGIDFISGRG